jgi:hypothetical protein
MPTLSRDLRRALENTVRAARRTAEAGARKVIEQLAVHHHEPWPSMTPAQRELRNRLRAHGRQLGDRRDDRRGVQGIDRLTTECAYEHWHRLLFARYLAECELLIEPQSGVAISLAECEELARAEGRDWLELAADYAQRMLPQIFRSGDPVLEVALPPETRSALEDLMKALPRDVFVADDSLGWVYQYWQADRKEEVNRSEKKIGADELPAVTQLFTEDYMVLFLLHNTLGAWWAGKVLTAKPALADTAANEGELRAACAVGGVEWTYLRFVREEGKPWRPAAGTFDGWPKAAKDITLLDPCMGSGHFLVFALPMLAAMRAAEERLSAEAAIEAVLRDNLFGLEIDPRCTQIAAFNLALAAWRRIGYRQLPGLHLACSGLSLGVSKAEWLKLAERAAQALPVPPKTDLLGTEDNLFSDASRRGFERLYDLFARAPWLGSLIDPRAAGGDLVEHGFDDLEPLLAQVMARAETAELAEMAVAAHGLARAAQLLCRQFTLLATNVPFLTQLKFSAPLDDFVGANYATGKGNLATAFILRMRELLVPGAGTAAFVAPQSWWFLKRYSELRKGVLDSESLHLLVRLGEKAFESPQAGGELVGLSILSSSPPSFRQAIRTLDVAGGRDATAKGKKLRVDSVLSIQQSNQLRNPDCAILFDDVEDLPRLERYATALRGVGTGDGIRFVRSLWEVPELGDKWECHQTTVESTRDFGGMTEIILWEKERGALAELADSVKMLNHAAQNWRRGKPNWGKRGVVVSQMGDLSASLYLGSIYDPNCCAIVPSDQADVPAIWALCTSGELLRCVRQINQNRKVEVQTILSVPVDIKHWRRLAAEKYPSGPPKPHSDDPTQWLFNGHPKGSEAPLQVVVARLAGYRWPRQTGSSFPDCPALEPDGLEEHADRDGIVALNPVKGEQPATARLLALLAGAFGGEWSAAMLDGLLAQVGFAGKTLDDWLRDGFFEQHCALFHQRPFVWHVWDGRRDGFQALVNYHRLAAPNGEGRRTLEKLLYSYLGDWIDRQRADQKAGVEGADARVAAAEHLKSELTNILAGEPPYDLFVRWKPLAEQPVGWEPDINDGVRINIRPFMTAKPLGARARGACILRTTPKIKWDKDRGKEPQRPREDFPWFWGWDPDNKDDQKDFGGRGKEADGNRWNDLHYTRAFKQAARARTKK